VPHTCPIRFTPHDIRHWFVTRYLLSAKARCARDGTSYADAKALFTRVMAWAHAQTVETYDHSLELVDGWAQLAAFQQELASARMEDLGAQPGLLRDMPVRPQTPASGGTLRLEDVNGAQELTADELAWLDELVRAR
jgi:hypothetical protein